LDSDKNANDYKQASGFAGHFKHKGLDTWFLEISNETFLVGVIAGAVWSVAARCGVQFNTARRMA